MTVRQVTNSQGELQPWYDILNNNFTLDEINSAIAGLKCNKSPGIDSIPAEFIKQCSDAIAPDLTDLFNYIIEMRQFPESWAEGIRTSVYKAGPRNDPKNYRGITVLSIFEKIFEILVQRRLDFIKHAYEQSDRYNGGFVKGIAKRVTTFSY